METREPILQAQRVIEMNTVINTLAQRAPNTFQVISLPPGTRVLLIVIVIEHIQLVQGRIERLGYPVCKLQ